MLSSAIRCSLLLAVAASASAFLTAPLAGVPALRSAACRGSLSGLRMAGFGKKTELKKGDGAKKKIMGIPKKILTDYGDLVKAGSKDVRVFAGVKGEDKWFECGNIASKGDETDKACQIHKRLILEYACDMHPVLKTKKADLQVGYSAAGDKDDDVVVLTKPDSTDGCECGFLPMRQAGAGGAKNLFHIDGRVMPKNAVATGAADEKGVL